MANDYARHGIRVNAVIPGFTNTSMTKYFMENDQEREGLLRTIPLGRPGEPEEVAAGEHLSRCLAAELASDGICVNAIAPGPAATSILDTLGDDITKVHEELTATIPLGRMGAPEELAWGIVQLVDPHAFWVTGAVIPVDGGQTLGVGQRLPTIRFGMASHGASLTTRELELLCRLRPDHLRADLHLTTEYPAAMERAIATCQALNCALEPAPDLRVRKAHAAMDKLIVTVDFLALAGFESKVISGGGTGTYNITGAHPRVTELQAGSSIVMDAFHAQLAPGFPVALTVLATVISRQGNRIVLDSGRKAVGSELGLPRLMDVASTTVAIAEEHLLVDVDPGSPMKVGDHIEVISGYGPTTVNLHDVYYIVENDVVTDIWPIRSRGAGLGSPY